MGNKELINQANQLPDNDGFVDPFFQNREALQIRINALSRSGNLSAKKAIYILQNAQCSDLTFPIELAAQIYLQLNSNNQNPMALPEKLRFVKSLFNDPNADTDRVIAHGVLDKKPSNLRQLNGQSTNKDEIVIFNFQLIVDHISTTFLLSHENWEDWLIRVTEICVLNINSLRDPSFDTFLETITNAIKETLSQIDEHDRHKLNALLSEALFRNFPFEDLEQLQKVVELSIELGVNEAEKNIHWQQVLQNPTPDNILRFSNLFENELPAQLGKFVTRSLTTFPNELSHSRLGNVLANLLTSNEVELSYRKAIVDKLSDIHYQFTTEVQSSSQIDVIDKSIRSLISNLENVRTTKHQAQGDQTYTFFDTEGDIGDYLVEIFQDRYANEILRAKLVDEDTAIVLVAQCLDVDPDFVNNITSQSNGLELLNTLQQLRKSSHLEQSLSQQLDPQFS